MTETGTPVTGSVEEYLAERSLVLAPRTIQAYRAILRDAERRTASPLSMLASSCLAELSAAWNFRDQNLSALRGYLRWSHHPLAERVPRGRPTDAHRQLQWYTLAELEEVVRACATPRERLLIHLACELMLRRVEIERLTWADLEPTSLRIHGKGRHGGKERRIPYHPYTHMILRNYLGESTVPISSMDMTSPSRGNTGFNSAAPSRRCSTTRDSNGGVRFTRTRTSSPSIATLQDSRIAAVVGLRRSALDKELKKIQESLRWNGVSLHLEFHNLRRTGARLFYQAGLAMGKNPGQVLLELSRVLGHESMRTTELYLGLDLESAGLTMAGMPSLETGTPASRDPTPRRGMDRVGLSPTKSRTRRKTP